MATVKKIRMINGVKMMNIEELLLQFEPMIYDFVKRCLLEINTSSYDYEDYYQFGVQALCEAFNIYDESKGCFSTLLTIQLKGMKSRIKTNLFAKKRGSGNISYISLNASDDGCIGIEKNLIDEEYGYNELEDNDFFNWVLSKLTDEEKIIFSTILGDKTSLKSSNLSNVSRMTVYRKTVKLKEKLKHILKCAC